MDSAGPVRITSMVPSSSDVLRTDHQSQRQLSDMKSQGVSQPLTGRWLAGKEHGGLRPIQIPLLFFMLLMLV